jgi:nifR3 family TIM-barrel protein
LLYICKTANFLISMSNFWQQLKKPIFCLAPMEEVTDFAFREMFARYSGLKIKDERLKMNSFVMFTEFLNVDGLLHPQGFEKLKIDLKFSEIQRPIVAQIWGRDPEKFFKVAQMLAKMGFDGIDINFGCPQSKEIQIGACAALIREPKLAQEIIRATQEGWVSAKDHTTPQPSAAASSPPGTGGVPSRSEGEVVVPVSVKTRIGYSKTDEMEEWVRTLLETNIAALTLHARTKQEMSKVPAHWEKIAEAVRIRDGMKVSTLIIGNGDVKSRKEGLARIEETKCDGVMIGRGAFGNPWTFRDDGYEPDIKERLRVMLEHAQLFQSILGNLKSFVIMRKHFKAYCSGFPGASELRAKLMEAKNLEETKQIIAEYFI